MVFSGATTNGAKDSSSSELDLYECWQALKRRWIPAAGVFTGVIAIASILSLKETPFYEAEGKLQFRGQDVTSAITGVGEQEDRFQPLVYDNNPISTEISIIRSAPVLTKTIAELELKDDDGNPLQTKALLSNLTLENERGTDILKITYRSSDPQLTEATVATLMQLYLEQHLIANRSEIVAAREFIEKQLPAAEKRVQAAGSALKEFKEQHQLVSLEQETSSTLESLTNLQGQMTAVVSQLADTTAEFQTLQTRLNQSPQTALAITAVSQSPGIQQALEDYQQVESELAIEQVRFHDQHPVIIDLETRKQNLSRLLQQRISSIPGIDELSDNANLQIGDVESGLIEDYLRLEARLSGLRQQLESLDTARADYEARAAWLPQIEQQHRELMRRLEAAQSVYSLLLERLQEVLVAENQNVGNIRIIQPAELSPDQITNKVGSLLAGGVLGGLLAGLTVFILEVRDQSIKTIKEIKTKFGFPIIGIIPFCKPVRRSLNTFTDTDDTFWDGLDGSVTPAAVIKNYYRVGEAYHRLRSNLTSINSQQLPKTIVVTSSMQREGKSTISSHLAIAIAQSQKRVLLIDADVHNPSQHQIWGIANQVGLSDVLIGQSTFNLSTVNVMPNLTVLPAGSSAIELAALLDSSHVTSALEALKAQYDFILFDAPSITASATATVLGKMVDGLLIVVRPGIADKRSVNYTKLLLEHSPQSVLGLVINGAIAKYEPYGSYLSTEASKDVTYENSPELSSFTFKQQNKRHSILK